jgi:hypothetical protein
MSETFAIASPLGKLRRRAECEEDAEFRFRLFCQSRPALSALPLAAAAMEQLMRLQFQAQMTSYRAPFPGAQFDIIELDGDPIGRIIVDRAIVPELRNRGIGTAISILSWTRPARQLYPSASRRVR